MLGNVAELQWYTGQCVNADECALKLFHLLC